jgi:hypothetical protein
MGAGLQRAVAAAKATQERPERTVIIPKILCHADGAVFANWHPGKADVYAAYLCDLDTPPTPESLKIDVGEFSVTDMAGLRWCPVIQIVQTGEPGEVEVTGPYDSETGEGTLIPAVKFLLYAVAGYFLVSMFIVLGVVALIVVLGGCR